MNRFRKIWASIIDALSRVPTVFWLFLIVTAIALLPFFLGREFLAGWKDGSEAVRNFGLGIAGIFAATFGVYLAWQRTSAATRQAETAQESHFTELYTKAIDQLGRDDRIVRIGGIYALERIAKDSPKDHLPIMEVLTSFVRQELPLLKGEEREMQKQGSLKDVPCRRGDVSAALKALGRRSVENDKAVLDLNMTNLGGALLDGTSFPNTSFFRAFLYQAWLGGSVLTHANFDKADLFKANFQNTDLSHASLREADATEAWFNGAQLVKADFFKAVLERSHVENANLREADLRHARLRDSNFADSDLERTDLRWADLSESSWMGCNLRQANMIRANASGTDLQSATLAKANLRKANLENADLMRANLEAADLREANLRCTNVRGANFERAALVEADFTDADFGSADGEKVNLKGADLTRAKGLTEEQLAHAECDKLTKLPDYLNNPAGEPAA